MDATVIDTLRYANRLREAGVEAGQAEAMARAINDELSVGVATREDVGTVERNLGHALAEFRSEMDRNLAELRGDMEHGLADLRGDMEHGLADLRGDMDRTRTELRAELSREVAEVVRARSTSSRPKSRQSSTPRTGSSKPKGATCSSPLR